MILETPDQWILMTPIDQEQDFGTVSTSTPAPSTALIVAGDTRLDLKTKTANSYGFKLMLGTIANFTSSRRSNG